jgi:hypothetical protein
MLAGQASLEVTMARFLLALIFSFFVVNAATATCVSDAADKKLAGAAKTSFLTKCERDSKATCDTSATDKKLAGAARTSFTKKCVSDAVGQ